MSKHAQSKQNSTISISARLLILILLANILSSCVTVIQTQVPIVPISEFTPTVQNPATQELTLVLPTAIAPEMPTLTLTPEPTATETPTPTKEKSLIEGNIFFDPQSKEDFINVALAPSPIDEPEKFALWREEYLKLVNENAEDYRQKAINEPFGIMADRGFFLFHSSVWSAVSSYKFKWQGQEILNKTFLYTSLKGDLIPTTFTYTPEDSHYFDKNYKYTTPDSVIKMDAYVFYVLREKMKSRDMNTFISEYLVSETSPETNEVIIKIWRTGESPTLEDFSKFSKTPLILWSFQEYK